MVPPLSFLITSTFLFPSAASLPTSMDLESFLVSLDGMSLASSCSIPFRHPLLATSSGLTAAHTSVHAVKCVLEHDPTRVSDRTD